MTDATPEQPHRTPMKITVFGATGRTGRHVVDIATRRGHKVTAAVRDAEAASDLTAKAELAVGQPRIDLGFVTAAIDGSDAVIVTLGPKTPFERSVLTDAVGHIVSAMEHTGARRLVVLSALGLSDAQPGPLPLRLAAATLLRNVAADKRSSEAIIRRSTLDWTIVLPGPLSNRPASARTGVTDQRNRMGAIRREDLALLLVTQAESPVNIRRAVSTATP